MKHEAYQHFTSKKTAPRYLPDFSIKSVLEINFATLKAAGVKYVLFDLDLTLRKRKAANIEADIISYLLEQQQKGAFKTICLATNNVHDVSAFSKPLGAKVFQPFYAKGRLVHKPHKLFFEHIIAELGVKNASEIVMVGDKLKYDVAPANAAGMVTILIQPIDGDTLFDKFRMLRIRERRLLKKARQTQALVQKIRA